MKTQFLQFTLTTAVLRQGDLDHIFPRRGGMVLLSKPEIENLAEAIALRLVFYSGAKKFFLERNTYFAIREKIWTLIDLNVGGLNATGLELYQHDEAVMEAAILHKAATADKHRGDSK